MDLAFVIVFLCTVSVAAEYLILTESPVIIDVFTAAHRLGCTNLCPSPGGSSAPPSVLSTHQARAPASLLLLRKTAVSVRRHDVTFQAVCSVHVLQTQVSRMLAGKYSKFFFLFCGMNEVLITFKVESNKK